MESGLTASDVAVLSGNSGRNNDAFGGDWGAWIILFLIFGMFGWGGFGGGFGGGYGGGYAGTVQQGYDTRADLQRGFDNQAVIGKLDGITQGICDSTYALNNTMANGFHGVDNAICNLGYQTQQGFNQTNVALMQGQNALATQLANCCCETREAIQGVNYNMATQACDTRNVIQNTTRDIIDSQNANSRAILEKLSQIEYNGLNDKYQAALAENQSLKFQASQTAQNAFITANQSAQTAELIRRLGADCPQPAYVVQPPQPVTFPVNGCGNFAGYATNNSCGCGYNSGCGNC